MIPARAFSSTVFAAARRAMSLSAWASASVSTLPSSDRLLVSAVEKTAGAEVAAMVESHLREKMVLFNEASGRANEASGRADLTQKRCKDLQTKYLGAIGALHSRRIMELAEFRLGRATDKFDRAAFWESVVINPENDGLFIALAKCEEFSQEKIDIALVSEKERLVLAKAIAKSMRLLYSYLSEGVHNPKGDNFVPVLHDAVSPKSSKQVLVLCDVMEDR